MKRQYVHLSSDVDTAIDVGKRMDESPIVFSVNSKESYLDGVLVFVGSQTVWLSENIEPVSLKIEIGLNVWQK
ncbi:MAG: hypothetical protein H0X50_06290 [Nitrosopumilus sp.]|nr:hypothetical protein [Nitrosopumilus sp.]